MTPKDWDRNEAAIKAAKEEILAAIAEADGKIEAGVTPQTKRFTNIVGGIAYVNNRASLEITGSGKISFDPLFSPVYAIVDGVEVVIYDEFLKVLYFNESIKIYSKGTESTTVKVRYYVQT